MDGNGTSRHRVVTSQGLGLSYVRAGSGPPLILIHGLVGSAGNWDQNLEALATVRTVYALDLANMGASDRVAELDAGLPATADLLADFMAALSLEAADIGGHSHGGAVALMLAARHPERVRKLILFAPANPFCTAGSGLIRFYNTQLGTWLARQIPRTPRFAHDLAHRRMYGDPAKVTQAALSTYTDGLNRQSIDHILRVVRAWWADMELLRGHLPLLQGKPSLILWGDRDRAVSLASGQELAATLGAQLIVVPGAGHIPFAEEPQACNQAVIQWLTGEPV